MKKQKPREGRERWEYPGASAWQQLVAVCSSQWEKTKPIGRCQCHANGDGEGQGQNYGYVHGNHPSSALSRLPEQGKDIRDRHHVLEVLRQPIAGSAEHHPCIGY
jgi:hypothetical protein